MKVGSIQDLEEMIKSDPLSVTKGSGLTALVASVALPLSTALGAFKGQPASVIIAAIALVAVVVVVAGYVGVQDMQIRSRQTLAAKRLSTMHKGRRRPEPDPPARTSDTNGHPPSQFPKRMTLERGWSGEVLVEFADPS
jgi:hypothetical protein